MDRQSIINEMFNYLVGICKIQTQQDLALAIGVYPFTISGAMNGNERNSILKIFSRSLSFYSAPQNPRYHLSLQWQIRGSSYFADCTWVKVSKGSPPTNSRSTSLSGSF